MQHTFTDMTVLLSKGAYRARLSRDAADIEAAQTLRARCFLGDASRRDFDVLDAACPHMLVEESASGRVIGCCRLLSVQGAHIHDSYSARFYDLSALSRFQGTMVEVGRFCLDPQFAQDPDVLRLAWGGLTRFVDAQDVQLLFGCSSFQGTDAAPYLDCFAALKARHLAPKQWSPQVKSTRVYPFAAKTTGAPDVRQAMKVMPALLKTYLAMGGWVSDHAVIDPELNTLHVFTGVEIGAIPDARKKRLRAVAS